LEARKIPLADPADFFPDRDIRLRPPKWVFGGEDTESLSRFLQGCGLSAAQLGELSNQATWKREGEGIVVSPSETVVRTLSSAAREKIYGRLAKHAENYAQQYPFRFLPDEFNSRFTKEELPGQKLSQFRALCYTNRNTICFADVEVLPSMLSSNEFEEVVEQLYATPNYRLRLRVYPNDDVERLVAYWGKGSNGRKIKPILESLSRLDDPAGTSLNISYLLPPFARLRLYTYPKAWSPQDASKADCFWTSMNFFNAEPDDRFLEPAFVRQTIQSEYEVVRGQPTYGDLITIVGPNGDGRHMCVYIADDFVYTKNGRNPLAPWVIMKRGDMLAAFTSPEEQQVIIVRRKQSPSIAAVLGRH